MYSYKIKVKEKKTIKDKRINIKISEKMMDEFKDVLERNEETISEVLRRCIRDYIKKNK